MAAADEQSLGEVARGVHRLEVALSEWRTEFRSAMDARVSIEAFEARMETERVARDALASRVQASETRLQSVEDERDRTRLALTVAILTALVAPIVVALLTKGI